MYRDRADDINNTTKGRVLVQARVNGNKPNRRHCIQAAGLTLLALGLAGGPTGVSAQRFGAQRPLDYRFLAGQDWSALDRDPYFSGMEQDLVAQTNAVRRRRGLSVLRLDTQLRAIARAHSADMLARGYFAHQTPEGLSPADRIAGAYRAFVGTSGENLWQVRSPGSVRPMNVSSTAIDDWLNSPSHRDNLLRPDHDVIAIGVAWRPNMVAVTQLFALPFTLFDRPLAVRWRADQAFSVPDGSVGGFGRPIELFWRAPHGEIGEAGRFRLPDARTPGAPGAYQLYLGYPEGGNRLAVAPGPWIEVG